MSKLSKRVYFFLSLVFMILFDRFLSNFFVALTYSQNKNSLFDFVLVQNQGAAFSILQGSKWFLILFSTFALAAILFYAVKNIQNIKPISLFFTAFLSAGIFCNTYERLIYGYVTDYLKPNFIDFPVFNVSDVFINISVFALVFIIIKNNYMKNNENNN